MSIVVFTEKNKAASQIAQILSETKINKKIVAEVPVYEFYKNGQKWQIMGLAGHIMGYDFPSHMNDWKSIDPKILLETTPVKTITKPAFAQAIISLGEKVGTWNGDLEVDIAVDPLEGTNLAANGTPGAISVMAMAERGGLFHGPDIYIDKIVVGPEVVKYERKYPDKKIDLDAPVINNLKIVAEALNRNIDELVVVILDRPRHKNKIEEIRNAGARVNLISDGDLMPGVATAIRGSGIHVVMGSGGSGEAVLTAAAMKILGGKILGRLVLPTIANGKSEHEILTEKHEKMPRLEKMGITEANINDVLDISKLAPGNDIIFSATGVTPGTILKGANLFGEGDARVHSLTMGSSGIVRFADTMYINDKEETPLRFN